MKAQKLFYALPKSTTPLVTSKFASLESLAAALDVEAEFFAHVLKPVCSTEHFVTRTVPFFQKLLSDESIFKVRF